MALQAHRAKSLAQKAAEHPYTVNPEAHVPRPLRTDLTNPHYSLVTSVEGSFLGHSSMNNIDYRSAFLIRATRSRILIGF